MGDSQDSERATIPGVSQVYRVAHSYLGSLWIALDTRGGEPGKPVLLRHLQLPDQTPVEALQRIACAGRDAMALNHENVLPVVAVLSQQESLAIAYAYVQAEPLRSLQSWATLRGLNFPVDVSLRIVVDLLKGVKALHGALLGWPSAPPFGGISPDSVLLSRDGRTRLCDPLISSCAALLEGFGFNDSKLAYAAPEQVHATAPLGAASDVFTCAAMLWELLTGRRLLSGSRAVIERKLLEHALPKLSDNLRDGSEVSGRLIDVVERSLSSDGSRRPQTPAALAMELEQCGHEVATPVQVARFVNDICGPYFERRGAAIRTRVSPELQAELESAFEVSPALGGRKPSATSKSGKRASIPAASTPKTQASTSKAPAAPASVTSAAAAAVAAPALAAAESPAAGSPKTRRIPLPTRSPTATAGAARVPLWGGNSSPRREPLSASVAQSASGKVAAPAPAPPLTIEPAASAPATFAPEQLEPETRIVAEDVAPADVAPDDIASAEQSESELDEWLAEPIPAHQPIPELQAHPPPPAPESIDFDVVHDEADPMQPARVASSILPKEELVPRVASLASPRNLDAWSHAPKPRSGRRGRAVLAGTLATLALGIAVVVALLLRSTSNDTALGVAPVPAATQDSSPTPSPAREPAPPAAPPQAPMHDSGAAPAPTAAPVDAGVKAPLSAPDAPADAPTAALELPPSEFASATLRDAQLARLFALESREELPSCAKRLGASVRRHKGDDVAKSQTQLKAARKALVRGDNEKALLSLCSATAHWAANTAAWQLLAELSLHLGDAAQAKQAIERALKRKPADPTLLGIQGDAWAMLGNLKRSRDLWARSAKVAGSGGERTRRLAALFGSIADRKLKSWSHGGALAYYRRAVVLSAGSHGPSAGMSETLRLLGQTRASLAWSERVASAFPRQARARVASGAP